MIVVVAVPCEPKYAARLLLSSFRRILAPVVVAVVVGGDADVVVDDVDVDVDVVDDVVDVVGSSSCCCCCCGYCSCC